MKKFACAFLTLFLAASMAIGFAACRSDPEPDPEPTVYSAPTITVNPTEMEITQGDEVSLLYGVTVTDEYDSDLTATVSDDDGFDSAVLGIYTVTYSATNSHDMTGTATRVYTVVAAPANLIVQAQQENDSRWNNPGYLTFSHDQLYTLTADAEYEAGTAGVFHNASTAPIVVTVAGGFGEAAILNSAGAMIEGRDGANGKLVNADNPIRTNSSVNSFVYDGVTYAVADAYASYMEIPAGGFAIVVVNNGGNFDEDGRGWLCKNVVWQLGAAVNIYFDDGEDELLNAYTDQAPVITAKAAVSVRVNDSSVNAEEAILEGITYYDDNGTWATDDDVTSGLTVEIKNVSPAFDVTTEGTYVYTLVITDGKGNETTFTRSLVVTPAEPTEPTISVDDVWYSFTADKVAVNPESVASVTTYDAIIYTSYFTGTYFKNDFGYYFIVGTDGTIREVYEPGDNKVYTLDKDGETLVETAGTQTDVLSQASALAQGEYLVLAVNGQTGTFRDNIRTACSASSTKTLGEEVVLWLIDIWPTVTVYNDGVKTGSFSGANVVVNEDVTETVISLSSFAVYTYAYKAGGGTIHSNGWGVAVVIDSTGAIVKVYDGVNGKYYDEDNPDGVAADNYFTASAMGADAYAALGEGETLLIFPNDGTSASDSPRMFAVTYLRHVGYTLEISNLDTGYEAEAEEPAEEETSDAD